MRIIEVKVMSKILYSYEKEMPTVSITRSVAEKDAAAIGAEIRFRHLAAITEADLEWCDILYFIRPNDPYSVAITKLARKAGRFVIASYDDDLYNLPESLPNPVWRKNSVKRMLNCANLLETTSPHIEKKYAAMSSGIRTYLVNTAVAPEEIKERTAQGREEGSKVKLVYAANPGHVGFFNRFILPIMPRLCQQYGDKISMTFMGLKPDLSAFENQMEIHYIPGMPLDEYRKTINEGNFDIGLSPLISDEFTKCKYFNKFIEYTMAGIAGVYSRTEPYTYVVEHGVNGFLAEDTEESWYEILSRAIEDAQLRNDCISAAQHKLKTEFNRETLMENRMNAVPEFFTYSAAQKKCPKLDWHKLQYRFVRLCDKLYLLLFYLRQGGIASVLRKLRKGY